jgi:poly-gamma-glutamate synthesis protein (capsule biosynthesis protein)
MCGVFLQSIREARKKADLVIVYQHNHVFDKLFQTIMREELPERLGLPEWLKKWTHAEMDAGADIIVMHGAPILHGVEIYHGHPIFFDLAILSFKCPRRAGALHSGAAGGLVATVWNDCCSEWRCAEIKLKFGN